MKKGLSLLAVVLIAGVILGIHKFNGFERYPTVPAAGVAAPDFTLTSQDGKPVSLKDYRGQWVVLYFYPNDAGERGRDGVHSFRRDLQKYQDMHTAVLGISHDYVSSHKTFADKEQVQFPLLSDVGLKIEKQYGAIRSTHLIFKYAIYSTFIIDPNGKVARAFPDFDPLDPSGEVLDALNTLQHG